MANLYPYSTTILKIKLNNTILKKYNTLKKEVALPLWVNQEPNVFIYDKLLALANGLIPRSVNNEMVLDYHNEKINLLKEVYDIHNQPILCICGSVNDSNRIIDLFEKSEVYKGNNEQIERWNNKEINILIGQSKNLKGVDLSKGSNIIVFYSFPTQIYDREQCIARLDRNNSIKRTNVYYLSICDTIDDRIIEPTLLCGNNQYKSNMIQNRSIYEEMTQFEKE